MIKAVIFDCFGVLVTDALERIVSDLGASLEDIEEIVGLVAAANRGSIEPEVYRTSVAERLGISVEEYVDRIKKAEHVNEPLLEYIKELKSDHKIGLLSNVNSLESLERRFVNGELELFDAIIASGQIGYAKPEAQAYEITAAKLGVLLGECVMVDDREDYCEGAIGVGMQAVHYRTLDQLKQELSSILSAK